MTTQRMPATAEKSLFTFYDIEALPNVFTLCAYTPDNRGTGSLEIFHLVDPAADGFCIADGIDHRLLGRAVFSGNPALPAFPRTRLRVWDLRLVESNVRLAKVFGLSDAEQVCHAAERSSYPVQLRPVCDTDPGYDPACHPFLAGFNSMNYDTVMLALYLMRLRFDLTAQHEQASFEPVRAADMREHNDRLFGEHIDYMPGYLGWDGAAAKIRRGMIHSGRHLDVARLNEQQFKLSLKRLLGILGHQIKESEKLGGDAAIASLDDLYELLAYNVSDCLGLSQLFRHPAYAGNFDVKAGLLAQYSETVFAQDGSVRRDRLTIDSSSARFVARILAPYAALDDIEAVSFMYPHPDVARARGVEPVNVLDECVRFFEHNVAPDPARDPSATPAQIDAHRAFMYVVDYYRSIEGCNFNDSEEYRDKHSLPAMSLREVPKAPNNLPYYRADATASSCFATFSTGGIHGAEADVAAFLAAQSEHEQDRLMLAVAERIHPDARDYVAEAKEQHNRLRLPDGTWVDKRLVLLGSDPEKVKYRKPRSEHPVQAEQLARAQALVPDPAELLATQRPPDEALDVLIRDSLSGDGHFRIRGRAVLANATAASAAYRQEPATQAPALFPWRQDGSTKLHPRFARTSAGLVIHEDFTSYYPNLLRNMRAFYNPELGEDRYARIFLDKERYGNQMKRPGLAPEEIARLHVLRNATKLILNSASGAGDAGHRTPIRMNNRIISMRILGQLFSWRIGQAQTLAGARIISTNTDGLYSVVGENGFDEAANNRVLAEQEEQIGVEIAPERMFLISKDSNNRLELAAPTGATTVADSAIITASGGTLACHAGPAPTKSLAHPAAIDFALARYLQAVASRGEAAFAEPFDPSLGREMIRRAIDRDDPVRTLLLFQNVLAASRGSITYPFAADPIGPPPADDTELAAELVNPRALQMVNRVFIVRDGTPGAVSLHNAGAWKVTRASQERRRGTGDAGVRRDRIASEILRHHGWARSRAEAVSTRGLTMLPDDQDVVVRRINGIDPAWSMLVLNEDLHALPARRVDQLICSLDLDVYLRILDETFTKNWMNTVP